ncbi:NAD-dependent DNA ligase LigA [Blattabacterium cuenoti]|uniref:NAD-dependent DNA ligase LigA n=1 Tax=Blattabacterium cuenoti TaxID=1653831 RepID=UPI00163CC6B4|nr:NAD-dependent DNA ligase LigA [Blattabacterium cuenoti]
MDHEIEKKIYKLRKELSKHNYTYYNSNTSDISDYHFDKKLKELLFLEKKYPELYDPNSPTIEIGSKIMENNNGRDAVYHKYKMYSLQNTYSKKELIIWKKRIDQSIRSLSFVCELKYDGVSINLIYKNGILTNAVTRGNGEKGEDVTDNIKTIKSIPLKLIGRNYPTYLEIRGEIFIPIKNFMKINKKRIIDGKTPYANPRNTASGTLRIRDSKEVEKRDLVCIVFHAKGKNLPFNTQYEAIKYIKNWGFQIPEKARFCKNMKEIFLFIDFWNLWKDKLPYQTDGIVIKVNELEKQSILGFTNKYPRWAIAYKFKQRLSETKLLDLTFQVGRTGIITPIAHVAPISISGTTVKRVALYNVNFIKKMGIHYEDSLLLEKSGNIIPKVTEINIKKRLNQTFPVLFLSKCPSCHSVLTNKNQLFYCTNHNCFSQRIEKIKHFVSEKAMNIKRIGSKIITKLYKKGFLYNFYDLYQLKKENLIQIDGIKEKLADHIINSIENSKNIPFCRVLYALGIRHVGEYISKKLTESFLDIHSLMHTNYNHLISISGIGKKIAESILTYFSSIENQYIVQILIKKGLHFSTFSTMMKKCSFFEEKSFVFTGKLNSMTRNKAKNIVENLGGKVYNSVNNKINFIVVGINFGSKLEKSMKKNHIQVLTENIFLDMLKEAKKEKMFE